MIVCVILGLPHPLVQVLVGAGFVVGRHNFAVYPHGNGIKLLLQQLLILPGMWSDERAAARSVVKLL